MSRKWRGCTCFFYHRVLTLRVKHTVFLLFLTIQTLLPVPGQTETLTVKNENNRYGNQIKQEDTHSFLTMSATEKVLQSMVNLHFLNCDIFLVYDETFKSEHNQSVQFQTSRNKLYTSSLLHNLPLTLTHNQDQSFLKPKNDNKERYMTHSNGVYITNLGNLDPNFEFMVHDNHLVHRKSSQCALVVVTFAANTHPNKNDIKQKRMNKKLNYLLTRTYGAVTRKDEDHYVFISNPQNTQHLTQNNNEFTKDLKFKLIILQKETFGLRLIPYLVQNQNQFNQVPNSNSEEPASAEAQQWARANRLPEFEFRAVSICFYCDAGFSQIVDLTPIMKEIANNNGPLSPNHKNKPSTKTSTINQQEQEDTDLSLRKLFPDFTRNAHGHELQVSAQTRLVFVYAIEFKNSRWRFRRGFGKSIVDGLTSHFNYTYQVHPAIGNGGSGAILPNGTWVGSVRDIIDGRADIGVAVALNYARYKLIGGNSFFYAWINFVMGVPKPIYSWEAIFWPFTPQLWFFTTLALVMVMITFQLLAIKEFQYPRAINGNVTNHDRNLSHSHSSGTSTGNGTLNNCQLTIRRNDKLIKIEQRKKRGEISTTIFSLVEQPMNLPKTSPSRILCSVWLLYTVIIITAYRSKVVSLMTFPFLQTLPKTFADLADTQNYQFKWGLESSAIGGAAHQHFRTSSNSVNKKIYSKMSLERDSEKCFSRGITQTFACITWSTQGEYILHRNFTNKYYRRPLVMSEDLSAIVGSGIAYRKRALFRYNFDRLVDSIREMGMADKWKWMDYDKEREDHLKWLKKGNGGLINTDQLLQSDVLILANLKGPFYVLCSGTTLALVVFFVEYLSRKPYVTISLLLASRI